MSTDTPQASGGISSRLEKAAAELRNLEQVIKAGEIDSRILRSFREAVDQIRLTGWAVQQWIDRKGQHKDPYDVLPVLAFERIRRMTKLCKDTASDVDAAEVTVDTPGIADLFREVGGLPKRLTQVVQGSGKQ